MRSIACLVALSLILGLCLAISEEAESSSWAGDDLCAAKSNTAPEPREGSASQDKYQFTHRSDVERGSSFNRYISTIHNDRSDAYLPAEWIRSDKTVEIAFSRIAPNGCASNQVETSLSEEEDSKAVIRYGPTRNFDKTAPLYIQSTSKGEEAKGMKLTSTIRADVQDEKGNNTTIDLAFTTSFDGERVGYLVTNHGKDHMSFAIPELTKAWSQVAEGVKFQWEQQGERFIAWPEKPAQQVFNVPGAVRLRERVVPVVIWSGANTEVGRARITLHLPERAADQ